MDQDFLPWLELCRLDQHLPRGRRRQRNGGSVCHVHVAGVEREGIFLQRDQFGEAADVIIWWAREDLVANLELPIIAANTYHCVS